MIDRHDIETCFEIFSSLTQQQRCLLRHLSPELRAALWEHHFVTFLATHPGITDEQRAVIEDAVRLTQQFSAEAPEHSSEVDAAKRRAASAFPKEQLPQLFYRIGCVD